MRIRGAGLGGGAGARARGRARPSGEDQPGFRTLVFGAQAVAAAGVALLAFLRVVTGHDSSLTWLVALVCAATLACGHLTWCTHGRTWPPAPVLAVQAALGFLPLLPLGAPWAAASGFFAGGVLLAFRPARSVPVALLACVVAGLLPARAGGPGGWVDEAVAGTVSAGVAALALFGLGTAARLVAERADEVRELKRRVVAEERERFSRDLHDLLGLSLSAITLKGELVDRLVLDRPALAKEELAELLVMSRRALADVRTIAAGYRELLLDDECRAAADVLSAAGTRVTVARSGIGELPPPVATALAMVLREGVTNVVRHSTASWCALSVSTEDGVAWLEIVNDGAGGAGGGGVDSGAGLRNLLDRVEALGGTLTTEWDADGTHRLLVAIPLRPRKPGRRRAS
ncbi:sensor histidine kinase [Amycolatopsis kentuckyensis]|uniref:sensor histidine kinase n=1 Tax=Amycolatopsis kentuckyensis TaxID=218823 RepID=UPI001FC91231|nr:histidine kinase [Amycolatopsis kentuckyensis]